MMPSHGLSKVNFASSLLLVILYQYVVAVHHQLIYCKYLFIVNIIMHVILFDSIRL